MNKLIRLLFAGLCTTAFAQSVVINEFRNASPDIVELLVIQDGLDMRGMILKDYSSSGGNDNGGGYTFANHSLWASLPAGTIIVLRKDNSALDTSVGAGDYELDVGLSNTTYFVAEPGTFDIAQHEVVQIKAAGSGRPGTVGAIHTFASGVAGTNTFFMSSPSPKLRTSSGDTAANESAEANNSNQILSDFDGTDALGDRAAGSIGTWNNANNQAFILSLRGAGPSTNVLFTASGDTINEGGISYTVTVIKTVSSGNVSGSVTLGGTASTPADYTINTTNFTLNGTVTAATFVITIVDDSLTEPNETVTLTLANVVGGTIASPSVFTLTITDNDAPPPANYPTNVITYQRFESGDPWTILDGSANVSSADGAADFPPLQRVEQGVNSWQVNVSSVTLDLAQVSISGFTNRVIKARVSSTSLTSANGADVGDFVRFFVALDSATFPPNFSLSLNGFNNARWGFWATNFIDVLATDTNSVTAPQGGLNSNNYSTIYIRIPDSATSVALRVWAFNDNSNEVWNVDNIEVLGDPGSYSPYGPAQTAYILANWGSIGAYTGDAADDDGDGYSNLEEFIAGTVPVPPTGAADYLRSIAITNALNRFVVTPSVTGRLYRLWATHQLLGTQSWNQVAGPVPGTGSNLSLTDGVTTNFRVYRLTVELENP